MQDPCGREVRYLRLSLTGACAMRCTYCRPQAWMNPSAGREMTGDEIVSLVSHLVNNHGIRKVRLTGGEPTQRRDLIDIVRRLAALTELEDLAMTTNGLLLAKLAAPLRDAGLRRLNISLDSLDPQRFDRITGVDALACVLRGIEAAQSEGFAPIKLNTVVVRGENEDQLGPLVAFAADRGLEIRFIELMPMGPLGSTWKDRYVPEGEMRERLSNVVGAWTPLATGSAAARPFVAHLHDGRCVRVGFVTAMSCLFCASCDRIRIGADGTLYPCLMDKPAGTLMPALRPLFDAEEVDRRLGLGLANKAREHPAAGSAVMTAVGG